MKAKRSPLALAGLVLAAMLASSAAGVPASAGTGLVGARPTDCRSPFDPYAYTQAAVHSCGLRTYPVSRVTPLPGGGQRYEYDEDGTVVTELVPPAGFHPRTASDAQLEEYGFPPRPADPAALAAWEKEMANWRGAARPAPFDVADPLVRMDTVYSDNWSGYAVTSGYGTFTHAEAFYVEPTIHASQCSETSESMWAGIGGYNTGDPLGQDGTAYNEPGLGYHQSWWELVPGNGPHPMSLYGHPGWEFDASTRWLGNAYRFYIFDYYTATTQVKDVSTSNYSGKSAEGILERPSVGGYLTDLSNVGTVTFYNTYANGKGFDTWSPTNGRHGIHMLDGVGYEMATPSPIYSGGHFTVTQNRCY